MSSYQETLGWARQQKNIPLGLKKALAFALPDLDWADGVALETDHSIHSCWGLFASINTEEACVSLAGASSGQFPGVKQGRAGQGTTLLDYLWTTVARLQGSAEPGLRVLLEYAWQAKDRRAVEPLLAAI